MGKKKEKKVKEKKSKPKGAEEEQEEAEEEGELEMTEAEALVGLEAAETETQQPTQEIIAPPEAQQPAPPVAQQPVAPEIPHSDPLTYQSKSPVHERIPQTQNTVDDYMVKPSVNGSYKVERSPPRDNASYTQKAQHFPSGQSGGNPQAKNDYIEQSPRPPHPQNPRHLNPYESAHSYGYPGAQRGNYGGAYGRSQQAYSAGGVQGGYRGVLPIKCFEYPRGAQPVNSNYRDVNTTNNLNYTYNREPVNNYSRNYASCYNYGPTPVQAYPTYGAVRIPQNPPLTDYGYSNGPYIVPQSQPTQASNNLNYISQNYPITTPGQNQMQGQTAVVPIICFIPNETNNR